MKSLPTANPGPGPNGDHRPGLKPPQFRLRTMFWAVAAVGVILVLFQTAGPAVGTAILLFGMVLLAHVAGNAIGTKLRQNGNTPIDYLPGFASSIRVTQHRRPRRIEFAPVTKLSLKTSIGRLIFVLAGFAAAGGAAWGAYFLFLIDDGPPRWADVSLSIVSFGVLGGLWGFWLFSLAKVCWQALAQSHTTHSRQSRSRLPLRNVAAVPNRHRSK